MAHKFDALMRAAAVAVTSLLIAPLAGATSKGLNPGDHWSFRPVVRPQVPEVRNVRWPRNEIDHFILARLEQEGVEPSPETDRVSLLRRVTLDLIGLPPTPEEVEEFITDDAPEAYERAVDRLLRSPHYGERWARHWLDVARYADSAGHEFDTKRPIWKYRDWVIQALNDDKPYDQFLVEQLAGDLLPLASAEQIVATGFSCNALKQYGDIEETTIDRVNAFGTAYLGLTVACAQCHDHPFDPISQTEYYQLYAFFNQAEDCEYELDSPEKVEERNALRHQLAQLKLELATYQSGPDRDPLVWAARLNAEEIRALPSSVREAVLKISTDRTPQELETIREAHAEALARFEHDLNSRFRAWEVQLTAEQRKALSPATQAFLAVPADRRPTTRHPEVMADFWKHDSGYLKRNKVIQELEKSIPHALTTLVLRQRLGKPKTYMFVGGDPRSLGDEVAPNTPQVLPPLKVEGRDANRLDLARWAASRDNPLTARVAVNRSWQGFFGLGIVETSDNLGTSGSEPSHPELLDWLATELMDHDWSMKYIHRLIVTSATYRQSSHHRRDLEEVDPDNRLVARQNRLRLEAEIIRDVALACSGLLDRTLGGPSVFPYQPAGIMDGRADGEKWVMSSGSARFRRGLYTHFWRLTPHPYLRLFDAPDASESCTRRPRTNTPLQALMLLNDPWFTETAVAFAGRACEKFAAGSDMDQLRWMFRLALARDATEDETEVLLALLHQQRESFRKTPGRAMAMLSQGNNKEEAIRRAAWTAVARVLLNLDEFMTRG